MDGYTGTRRGTCSESKSRSPSLLASYYSNVLVSLMVVIGRAGFALLEALCRLKSVLPAGSGGLPRGVTFVAYSRVNRMPAVLQKRRLARVSCLPRTPQRQCCRSSCKTRRHGRMDHLTHTAWRWSIKVNHYVNIRSCVNRTAKPALQSRMPYATDAGYCGSMCYTDGGTKKSRYRTVDYKAYVSPRWTSR